MEWSANKQPQFTALGLPFMFTLLSHEVVLLLRMEQPAVKRLKAVELDEDENVVRRPATSAHVVILQEDHRTLVYKAEASPLGFVHTSFLKKRKPSTSMMTTGLQRKKVTRASFDERVKVAAENVAKVEDVTDVTTAVSGALVESPIRISDFDGSLEQVLLRHGYFFERSERPA